ncbi:MAG: MMPL family transporter [Gemmatimonadota bacterium]|nr:MAG: MMPL family transporter [Gemmatimonadota bacterium]
MPTFADGFRFLIERRASVLVIQGLLLAVALVGAGNLQVDYSAEQFFLFGGPEREVFDQFKRHFPREDLQVSALLEVAGPLRLDDYRTLERLAEAFRSSGLQSVRWLGEADLVEETLEDGRPAIRLFQISEDEDWSESRINALLEARREHPLFSGTLWNSELTVFAVHGYLAPAENDDARRRQLTRELQDEIRILSPGSGRIVLTGLPVLRATIPLALEADLVKLLGIGLLISFLVLYGYFRRLGLVLLCLGPVVPAILFTLGMMGWAGQPISVLTSFMPIVVLVVAVSDATHLVMGTRSRWQEGLPISDAVVDTFSSVARTCFFTSLTTALGFLGLIATRIPVIVEFGVITAVAVLVAYLVTLTLLPALLTLASDLGTPGNRPNRWSAWIIRRIERTLHASPRWTTAVLLAGLITGLVLGVGLRVEALLIDDLKPDDPILRDLRWIEDAGFGLFQVNVYLTDGNQPGHSQEMLRWIEDLQTFARSDPIVIGSMALPDFVRELGAAFGSDGQARASGNAGARATRLAWTTEEVRELLFLAELEGEDALEEVYVRQEGVGQVILYVRDSGSTHLSPFLTRLEDRLDSVPPPSGSAYVTGTVKLSQVLWDQLLARFLPGVLFSMILVWIAMAWMFRSVRLGLLALVPNVVPMVMLLGLMRVGGFDLKPSTVIVFAIAFGIVADDTIHFLGAVARRLRATSDIDAVLLGAVREVGPAIIITTAVVGGGFIALTASRFQALFLIGFLTAAAALFAVGADLVGFPALLRLVARRPWVRSLLQRGIS